MAEENVEFKSTSLTSKETTSLYKNTFGNIQPHEIYHDPTGARAGRPVNKKEDLFEAEKDVIEKFNELQRKGFSVKQSIERIQKNLDTGDWSLPVYHLPEVSVVNPYRTPLADLMPRETVQNDTVKVQAETGVASPSWALESTADPGSQEYTYGQGTYDTYSYSVIGYGLATVIEDKLQLASRSLRASESVVENSLMISMRYEEEKQIIQGDGTSGNANDTSGWQGLRDLGTSYESVTDPTAIDNTAKTRELIDECEDKGADRDNVLVVCDRVQYRNLKDDMTDFTRYEVTDEDEIGFGFRTMEFDGVPVTKSHGFTNTTGGLATGDPFMYAVDLGTNYVGALQDTTLKPLAKTGPQERIAIDSYTALVSEAQPHIQFYEKS